MGPDAEHNAVVGPEPLLVSVVVPVRNRARLVLRTLDSVLAQRYRPLQLIVVDDGSSDGSAAAVRDWADQAADADLASVVVETPHGGASAARNRGAALAAGRYLQFLDSDDLLEPDKIARQVAALEQQRASYAWCRTVQMEAGGRVLARLGRPPRHRYRDVPGHQWHISALLLRRDCWQRAGPFAEDLPRSNDWEHAARVKLACGHGLYLPFVGSRYVVHGEAQLIHGDALEYARAREQAIRGIQHRLAACGEAARPGVEAAGLALAKNALRFAGQGQWRCAQRNLRTAAGWLSWPLRGGALLAAAALGLLPAAGQGDGDASVR